MASLHNQLGEGQPFKFTINRMNTIKKKPPNKISLLTIYDSYNFCFHGLYPIPDITKEISRL